MFFQEAVLGAIDVQIQTEAEVMIVVDPDRVVRNKMTVAPVFAVAVFSSSLASNSFYFDGASGAYADLYAPILHERPIDRVVVVAKSRYHAQDQVAAAPSLP